MGLARRFMLAGRCCVTTLCGLKDVDMQCSMRVRRLRDMCFEKRVFGLPEVGPCVAGQCWCPSH
jgi:hypothetical protein